MLSIYGPCDDCILADECAEFRAQVESEPCLIEFWRRGLDAEVQVQYAAAGIAIPEAA